MTPYLQNKTFSAKSTQYIFLKPTRNCLLPHFGHLNQASMVTDTQTDALTHSHTKQLPHALRFNEALSMFPELAGQPWLNHKNMHCTKLHNRIIMQAVPSTCDPQWHPRVLLISLHLERVVNQARSGGQTRCVTVPVAAWLFYWYCCARQWACTIGDACVHACCMLHTC